MRGSQVCTTGREILQKVAQSARQDKARNLLTVPSFWCAHVRGVRCLLHSECI